MNPQFWKSKTVLLTGHTGFKGSWLSLWLQKLRVNLIGFSKNIPTTPSLFELANVEDGMTSIMGDICDYKHLEEVIREYKPQIVIHMAAQTILDESYKNPIETYATNVMGTVNILESIRKIDNVRTILNVTSDKCYEVKEFSRGYKEDDPMGGYDPYSSSKGCAELVTSSFRNSFFNPKEFQDHQVGLASVRAGNVIGGGDWASNRLVPDIVRGVMEGKTIKIRNPDGIRPWQHVLEPLTGYLLLVEKLWNEGQGFSEGWNFGPNDDDIHSVSWILEKISQYWDGKVRWETSNLDFPSELNQLRLDCSKARKKLGWAPKTDLNLGLEWTIKWYEQYMEKKGMKELIEDQIDAFNSL